MERKETFILREKYNFLFYRGKQKRCYSHFFSRFLVKYKFGLHILRSSWIALFDTTKLNKFRWRAIIILLNVHNLSVECSTSFWCTIRQFVSRTFLTLLLPPYRALNAHSFVGGWHRPVGCWLLATIRLHRYITK